MKKKIIKNDIKKWIEEFHFHLYIIHKMLVFIKNHMNYLEDNAFEFFFKKYDRVLVFSDNYFSSQYIMIKNPRLEEKKIIKSISL